MEFIPSPNKFPRSSKRLKLGLKVRTSCAQNTSQPGGGRGGLIWAPSGWGTSWRTCCISEHTLLFGMGCFIACWNGENWVSRCFWLVLTPCWIKLLGDRHTPEKLKINANFNRVVCLSFSLQLISMNGPQIQSREHVKGRKLGKKYFRVSSWFWYYWSFVKIKD